MRERKEENTISITVTGRIEMCTYSMLMMHQDNVSGVSVSCHHAKPVYPQENPHNISINKYKREDILL